MVVQGNVVSTETDEKKTLHADAANDNNVEDNEIVSNLLRDAAGCD